MSGSVEIPRGRVHRLAPLYAERTTLRAVVDAILEERLGTARADDVEQPRAARLDLGCYAVFGGDVRSTAARDLVAAITPPRELVFPDSDSWRRLLRDVHPVLSDRSMRSFDASGLDRAHLLPLAAAVAPGYEVRPVDAALAARLGPDVEPHGMQVYDSPASFERQAIGFCAVRGETIACAATSYTLCSSSIELAIATHPAHRRRGLARAVAATLILRCLERGLVPHWNAADPFSQRLAQSLGYRPAERCEILFFDR